MKERQAEKGSGAKIYKQYERGARREGERMKESAGKGKREKERQEKERGRKNEREVRKEGEKERQLASGMATRQIELRSKAANSIK